MTDTTPTAVADADITPDMRGKSLKQERRWALWGSYAALTMFTFMFLIPPIYTVTTSLKTSAEISSRDGNPWLIQNPTL